MFVRTPWLVASVLAAALAPASAPAAPVPVGPGETGLAAVPAQSPIVIHIRGVERTKDRLAKVLSVAVPDFGPVAAAQIDALLKGALEGRKLQGVVNEGPVFVALLELPAPGVEIPASALIARVTRYAEFRDGLLTEDERKTVKPQTGFERVEMNGKEAYFVDLQGFAAITPSKDVATLLAKKPEGMAGKLAPEIARGLLENDLSVYVNLAAVNRQYGEQIKSGRQFVDTIVDAMPVGGAAEKASIEMAKGMFAGLFQAVEDGKALVAALDFRPEGLNLNVRAQVGPESKTNKFLKDLGPAALADLGTMPAGQMTYTGAQFSPSALKTLAPMIYGAMGGEGETRKQIEAALEMLVAAGGSASYGSGNVPASGVQVQTFRDPAKAAEAQFKLFKAMADGGTLQGAYIKGKPELRENAETYKGFKLSHARFEWDLDKLAESVPGGGEGVKAAMKKLMGEGMRVWFGTDGRRFLTVTAADWDAAKAQIDAYLDGRATLAQEPAFKLTRQQLPSEATMLFLTDAGKFTQVMADYMLALLKAMPGLPFNLPGGVKPVPTETSYIGAAITLKPEFGSFDLFIPAVGVREMRKVIVPLFLGNWLVQGDRTMRMTRRPVWLGLAVMAGLAAGCQSRLNVERAYKLDIGTQQDLTIDPPRHDQRVSVSVTSDAPVTVYLYLQKDRDAVVSALRLSKKPDKVLATADQTQSAEIEATIPAKEPGMVTIETGTKAASVTVKIKGK